MIRNFIHIKHEAIINIAQETIRQRRDKDFRLCKDINVPTNEKSNDAMPFQKMQRCLNLNLIVMNSCGNIQKNYNRKEHIFTFDIGRKVLSSTV